MRNMKLRLISAALATCMMASVLPASAVAAFADDVEDSTSVTTPAEDELLKNDTTAVIEVKKPGTYRMEGNYRGPLDIVAEGDVTINITDTVTYTGIWYHGDRETNKYEWKNYAIRVKNAGHTVTVNTNGHSFIINGNGDRGGAVQVDGEGCHAIVNGGFYEAHDDVYGKEIFYNNAGTMELNDVHAEGEILLKHREGETHVNGGVYKRVKVAQELVGERNKGAIISTITGTLILDNVEVSAETGSALLVLGGDVTVKGGSLTTKDANYSAVYTAVREAGDDFAPADNDGGGDGYSKGDVIVKLDGTTVKDSNNALKVKNGKTVDSKIILKDTTFENNKTDVLLEEGQKFADAIEVAEDNSKSLDLKVADASGESHNVQLAVLTVEGGTVTVDDSATIEGEKVTVNKKGDTTTANLPANAHVTVTYDEAAYADSNLKFGGWSIEGLENAEDFKNEKTFQFDMPTHNVTIKAVTPTTDSDDGIDAATVITGVAIGAGTAVLTYHIGTELYAEQVLGKGVAVPKTREDVALKAWELAGKPAVELNGERLSEAAQAEKWAVESGLMQNVDGNFNGAKKMNKLKALRVLDKAQKMG